MIKFQGRNIFFSSNESTFFSAKLFRFFLRGSRQTSAYFVLWSVALRIVKNVTLVCKLAYGALLLEIKFNWNQSLAVYYFKQVNDVSVQTM